VMVSDHAVNAASDDNGPGQARTVMVDVSALGPFSNGTQRTLDANTDAVAGPAAANFTPASQMTFRLGGYGTTFLTLSQGGAHALPAAVAETPREQETPLIFEGAPEPPAISMTVAPATIALGQSARIAWSATNANSCTGSDNLAGAQPVKSSMIFTPMVPGSYRATLTCTGVGGTVTQSGEWTVKVL